MTRRELVIMLLAAPMARAGQPERARVTLSVASDGDELAFVPDRLRCVAGDAVRLRLHHTGTIIDDPHDWVLLKPGTEDRFLADADRQSQERVIPPHDAGMVIAATSLCPRGGTVTVNFIAPAAGDYPFVCSVPGHGSTMRGVLTIAAKANP